MFLRNHAWATFHLQQLLGHEHLTTKLHYLKYINIFPQKRRQAHYWSAIQRELWDKLGDQYGRYLVD
jgi:hypothetical protein